MTARNAKAFIVEQMPDPAPPGAIKLIYTDGVTVGGFDHACPCGCGKQSFMGIDGKYNASPVWKVTAGNFREPETLTLSPSIGVKPLENGKYHWHGYLRDGVFVEE